METPQLLRTSSVAHRALQCARPFDEVHRALIDFAPALRPELGKRNSSHRTTRLAKAVASSIEPCRCSLDTSALRDQLLFGLELQKYCA
jgi:hypothetical protein